MTRAAGIVVLSALLAACTPTPSTGPDAGKDTQTIQGWPSGEIGRLELIENKGDQPVVGRGNVDGSGKVSYSLGVPAALRAFTPGPLIINPPDAKYQNLMLIKPVFDNPAIRAGDIRIANRLNPTPQPGDRQAELIYVDRDVSLTGTAGTDTYNLVFKQGWNYQIVTFGSSGQLTYTASRTLPDDLQWFYVPLPPGSN
ncbi:MAG TPA: hypothetical protein VFS50_17300 [Meiothermus sp.]|jgi:hypothetical protein|nr:hypothetical protein [Meiothermus sp.]